MSAWASWDPDFPHHHLLVTTVPQMKAIECLPLELSLRAHLRMPRWGTHQVGEKSHSLPSLCLEELWDINDVTVREAQLPLQHLAVPVNTALRVGKGRNWRDLASVAEADVQVPTSLETSLPCPAPLSEQTLRTLHPRPQLR